MSVRVEKMRNSNSRDRRVNRPASFSAPEARLVVGTYAHLKAFGVAELSTYGMGKEYYEFFLLQAPNAKPSEFANMLADLLVQHGFLPHRGYQSLIKNSETSPVIAAYCRCCGKVEKAARDAVKKLTPAPAPAPTPAKNSTNTDMSVQDGKKAPVAQVVKIEAVTIKAEMAAILASIQQANIEGDSDKIELLILEAQQLLVKI